MPSEDITFCANQGCTDMKCFRNPKHIRSPIPHSFALFTDCPKWNEAYTRWLWNSLEMRQNEETKK